MKSAIFRVDGAPFMGIGHIMRCLTLADKLKGAGWNVRFISRAFDDHFANAIVQKDYDCSLLPAPENMLEQTDIQAPPHAHWLGVDWQVDAAETSDQIKHCDLLIVDHYGIDARWHQQLRGKAERIFVIDDLADRLLDCDYVLDQTYGRDPADYKDLTPEGCQRLCGSEYMLLRDVFSEKRSAALTKRQSMKALERVFICMGSGDPTNVTERVLEGLNRYEPNLHLDVILSSKAPYLKDVQSFETHHALHVHTDCPNVQHLMVEADIAFGAGGTMSWERCCLGLPTLLVVIAENQRLIAEKLEDAGATKNLGWHEDLTPADVFEAFDTMNIDTLKTMAQRSAAICDGHGAQKVLEILDAD